MMADTAEVQDEQTDQPEAQGAPGRGDQKRESPWPPYVREVTPPSDAFKKTAAEHLINPPEFPKLDRS